MFPKLAVFPQARHCCGFICFVVIKPLSENLSIWEPNVLIEVWVISRSFRRIAKASDNACIFVSTFVNPLLTCSSSAFAFSSLFICERSKSFLSLAIFLSVWSVIRSSLIWISSPKAMALLNFSSSTAKLLMARLNSSLSTFRAIWRLKAPTSSLVTSS